VDLEQIPKKVRAEVAARTASLIGRPHLRLSEIERRLLVASDVAGVKLMSTLMRGEREGGSRLVLQGRYSAVTGAISTDDRLSRELGVWQLEGTFALNSIFGLGEQLYISGSLSDPAHAIHRNSPVQVYGGGAVLAFGQEGLTVNPEYTHSVARTPAGNESPAAVGALERWALHSAYPVLRSRRETLNILMSLEEIEQTLEVPDFGIVLNHDRYSAIRAGFTVDRFTPWGASLLSGVMISEGLGGRSPADSVASRIPLSRQGASPDFTKASASIRMGESLPLDLRLNLVALGQAAFGSPLLRSEQFSLDGPDALSAFTTGTFSVDQGATMRCELARPIYAAWKTEHGNLAPYLFAAAGRGSLLNPTSAEQKTTSADSLGAGARGAFETSEGSQSGSFGAELAHQHSDVGGLRQGWRVTVNATVAF
jgi:hemolysin activation/secretion protein